jgi:transposase InsO family protein
MCRVLAVSRAGFYRAQGRPASARVERDDELLVQIHAVHHATRQRYGAVRTHQVLRQSGEVVGHNRVARLMRDAALVGTHLRRYKGASVPRTAPPVPAEANHLARQFAPSRVLNRAWVADITWLPYPGGRAFLAAVLDVASRKLIGWELDTHMQVPLVEAALRQAIYTRRPPRGLVHHSDRGGQYTSLEYQHRLTHHGFVQSVSAKGNCYDNAVVESFFATCKRECDVSDCHSLAELRATLFEYLELFYNRERLHSSLGYCSPTDYEKQLDPFDRAA